MLRSTGRGPAVAALESAALASGSSAAASLAPGLPPDGASAAVSAVDASFVTGVDSSVVTPASARSGSKVTVSEKAGSGARTVASGASPPVAPAVSCTALFVVSARPC